MNNKYPLVSVIIPVYNNVLWLEEAVKSVLAQDYPNIEILVINDGSTEVFDTFLNKYANSIRYYYNKNKGVAYTRNFGIDKANGDYIAFLDSDDLWTVNKISIQVKYMQDNGLSWSQHDYIRFDDKTKKLLKKVSTKAFQGDILRYIFTSCLIQTSCVMVERKILLHDKNIRFDENKRYGEDNAFYLKLANKYFVGYINQALTYYRVRGENAGTSVAVQLNYRSNVYKEYHDLPIYKINTNLGVKLGYKYCYIMNRFFSKLVLKDRIGAKFIYVWPWIIFKINYFFVLCRRR